MRRKGPQKVALTAKPKHRFVASLMAVLLAASPASSAELSRVPPKGLKDDLNQWVGSGFPSLSVAIASSCGVRWAAAAGEADIMGRQPAAPSHLYGIGSIAKTLVAVVILQLAEEGKLRLGETAAKILGTTVTRGVANADTATLAQLMNHTSGIPSWEDASDWIRDARGAAYDPGRHWPAADGLSYIRGLPPVGTPGSRYHYSNTDYTLLGLIIENVTGQALAVEIRQRILDRLKLHDSYLEGFEPVPERKLPRRYHFATQKFKDAAGVSKHFPEVRPGLIDVSASRLSPEWAAGGMVMTANDLARFAQGLRDGKLLKPESLKFMTKWQPTDDPGTQVGHGLFRTLGADGQHQIGHTGGVLGFTADMEWIEEADVIVVKLTNVGVVDAGDVPLRKGSSQALLQAAQQFLKKNGRHSCR